MDRHVQHELHNKIKSGKMSISITANYPAGVKQRDSQFGCHPTGGAICPNCTAEGGVKSTIQVSNLHSHLSLGLLSWLHPSEGVMVRDSYLYGELENERCGGTKPDLTPLSHLQG